MALACVLSVIISTTGISIASGPDSIVSSITASAASTSTEEFLASGYDTKNMTVYD